MDLSAKQTECIELLEDKIHTEICFGGGAGGGKSQLGCCWILRDALQYEGTRWVIGRNGLKTLRETTLQSLYDVMRRQGIRYKRHYTFNSTQGLFKLCNSSEIYLKDLAYKPSDPDYDELGSLEITGAFVDEFNQIRSKGYKVLKSRIRYKLDENGLVPKLLGTCNPSKGYVYTDFYSPSKRGTLPPYRAFVQSLVGDNPFISEHYKANLLTLDKASIERLLYGNWDYDDDPTVLCDYDAVCDIFTNKHVKPTGSKYLVADLAMQGRDHYVQGPWDGMVGTIELVRAKSSGLLIEKDLQHSMIANSVGRSKTVVDSDGMGAYLESYLTGIKEFHGGAKAKDDEFFNLKCECAYKLAELVNKREIYIICPEEYKQMIIEELAVLKSMSVTEDEKRKRIISKDMMKQLLGRSPDFLDWLIMRMYFVVMKDNIWMI